jgi:DNA invertase Pin-like site-specific DNA recombinase
VKMSTPKQKNQSQVALELIRVSTPKQVELGGLESQHADCVSIAQHNRIELHPEAVSLAGVSGKNVRRTPEIQRLEEMLRSGKFMGVVMVEDTRLMRANEPEDYALLQVFKDCGVKIFTKTAVHDMSTPEGMMLFQILMAIAGRERHVIKARTYGKREKLRARGLCASGANTLPHGFVPVRFRDGDGDRWAYGYDEGKISQVRRAFDLLVSGVTNFRTIALETGLTYAKVREGMLRNTAYIGFRTYDKRVDPSLDEIDDAGRLRYQRKVRRPEDEVEKVPMLGADGKPLAPAIPPDLFWRAQEILNLKSEMGWRRNTTNPERYTFRGFLKCADCGQRLLSVSHRVKGGGSVRDYYVCKASYGQRRVNNDGSSSWVEMPDCNAPRIRREHLEPMLESVITGKLGDPEVLYAIMQSQRKALTRGDNGKRIVQAKQEVSAVEGELARLNVLFRKGRIDEDELDREAARLDAALKAARRNLNTLSPQVPQISPEALVHVIAPFDRWDLLNKDDRRALLMAVCPLFDVRAVSDGGRGASANTQATVIGFYLRLSAGDDAPGANDNGRGGSANGRAIPQPVQLVSNQDRSRTDAITDQLVYFPLVA